MSFAEFQEWVRPDRKPTLAALQELKRRDDRVAELEATVAAQAALIAALDARVTALE